MSPGGRPYLSVGSEAEGAAGDDSQISFTTQLMKILFTARGLASLSTGLDSCGVFVRATAVPLPPSVQHLQSHNIRTRFRAPLRMFGRAKHGWRDCWCQLSVARPSVFCSAPCKRKDGWTVIARVPRNTHTAHARTHKHGRACCNATRADVTFHFSIKDSAFSFPPSPPCQRAGKASALLTMHKAQIPPTHLRALRSSDWGLHTHTRSPL